MTINLKSSASTAGTFNTYDHLLNFVSDFGAVGDGVTDNGSALSSFNTAYAALAGRTQLTIPPGDYAFTSAATWGALGGTKLVISAYGATLRNQNGFANSGQYNDNLHHANIQTVSAGNSTVTLVTSAQTSRFSVGEWVVITEGDTQGFGFPTNPWKLEFQKIASIGTGTLTFTQNLAKSYSSAYPNYAPGDGSNLYQGGPATVYALNPIWDQEIELKGAFIKDNGNLFYGKIRQPTYTDCIFETYGPCPTENILCTIQRCTTLGTELEVDKLVDNLIMRNNNLHAIVFQNQSVNNLIADSNTVASGQYWRGVAGASSIITNLTADTFWFGLFDAGVAMGNATLNNCSSTTASYNTSYRFALANYGQPGSGALTITSGSPQAWAVPGAWCVLLDASGNFSGISFQVTNIAFSGGVTTVSTTLSTPVPSTAGGFSAPWFIVPHPGKDTTLVNCTGNSVFTSQSALPAHSPVFDW